MMLFKKYIILCIAIVATQMALSQTFTAKVSKATLGLDERLRIQFTFDQQGMDDFTPPNFQNFEVVQGPSRSTNFYNYNGKKSFKISYTYIIQPKAVGKFVIPAASATYNDKTITTNTVNIRVNKGSSVTKQQQQKPTKAQNQSTDFTVIANENIHLIAEISNTNPFVGESISIVYKLYMNRNNAAISNERESKAPTYNGFWNQNIQIKQLKEQKGTFNGKEMSYYILRKDVLIPQQVGKLTVTPLKIDATVVVAISGKRDFFGRRMQKSIPLVFSTGHRTINVKALPKENKPSNFSGAVGDFAFKVSSTKKTIKANESAQIKVTLQGNGNLKLISLPKIETPKGLEQFTPEHNDNVQTRLSGLRGSISDTYTVVPQYRGKYKIPSLAFSFFNPKTKQYKTLNSAPIVLNVPNGKMPEEENTENRNKISQTNYVDSDIRFIHTKTSLKPKAKQTDFFKSGLFWLLLLLPLLAIPFGIYIGKKKQARDSDVVGNKKRKANKLAKKYLSAAKKELGNKEPFYIALEKALHNYLKAKLQVETSEISKDRITELLQKRDVDNSDISQFIKVLDDCDFARYTPTSNLQMEHEYNKAIEIITNLDKQL